ncbi:copper amine oxidase N-terminal domain-containing protein [Paenibacillus sp. MMS20-IR301]|uniref:copper amine oxidase N-terminal domain-containing protein n=1 Tax=Paenibacillus sp. MMS20-IR301 TaxID=2895946 RepID=UPI0028E26684|nr:copper amine oxidase N-terminal domain-containing protein [Paenibacillus sp. MMS20-IR301]WNS41509.1 copper amine oxidase N-terminal domain-containing protein [Paenibacillus sp. MMS20-IR301]
MKTLIMLLCAGLLPAIHTAAPAQAAPVAGGQIMPVMINNQYVLFPGKLAPYMQAGRLMVPVRALAGALGAQLTYDAATKSSTVSLLGESVGQLRAGQATAVTGNGSTIALGASPQLREGVLFVPMNPLLTALKKVKWENMSNVLGRNVLLVQGRGDTELPQAKAWQSVTPFGDLGGEHQHPFYPTLLTQTTDGKSFRLSLSVINASGFVIPKATSRLEFVAVDSRGQAVVRQLPGPSQATPKAAALSFTINVPTAPDYVIFNSRTE